MKGRTLFEKNFKDVELYFPKLSYSKRSKSKTWIISGELDICDIVGTYWNTYEIAIVIPDNYPNCVPIVFEKSNIIPRSIAWHISPDGCCCIDIPHALIIKAKKGINICKFIKEQVYPYFANQTFKLAENTYAGKEYAHSLNGIIQYYIEEHHLPDVGTVLTYLEKLSQNLNMRRNEKCPCGSNKKVKHCHEQSIESLKIIGVERIFEDLQKIKIFIEENFSQ